MERLVSAAEAAKACGLSRQRIHYILQHTQVYRLVVSPKRTLVSLKMLNEYRNSPTLMSGGRGWNKGHDWQPPWLSIAIEIGGEWNLLETRQDLLDFRDRLKDEINTFPSGQN